MKIDFIIKKYKKEYKITVNEDLSASINNQPAYFDVLYNAVVLREGYIIEEEFIQGLRVEPKYVKEINEINKGYHENYTTYLEEQREFVPKQVRISCGRFVYSSPFSPVVTESEVVEKLNLFIQDDVKLIKKIAKELMDEEGNIEVKDLLKMTEYKKYLADLKRYEKINQKREEKQQKFEEKRIGKIEVGLNECISCGNIFIVGDVNGKFLPRLTFFDARTEMSKCDGKTNPYSDFCWGMTENFIYYMKGKAESCKQCKIE